MRRIRNNREGFSLLEVIVSTGLLFMGVLAFFTMTQANGRMLLKSRQAVRDEVLLEQAAMEGKGERSGEPLRVIFDIDGQMEEELFDRYRVTAGRDKREMVFFEHQTEKSKRKEAG